MKIVESKVITIADGLIESVGSRRLDDIVDYLGITVKYTDSKICFYRIVNNKEYIYISNSIHEDFKPFALAHEIGHAVLHSIDSLAFSELSRSYAKYELEADKFAFYLLGKEIDTTLEFTYEEHARLLGVSERIVRYEFEDKWSIAPYRSIDK